MSERRSLALIRGSFERAQWALNVSCYEYSVTGLVSKSVSALASVHPQSRMRHGVTPLKLTPPSHNSRNRFTLASTQPHRPRRHNPRLTRCYVLGTLKDPASSGRPLDPSALRLNEWRKNALDGRSGTLTAASKHIGSSAARATVQHMAARHRCRHCCCKGRAHEDEQLERRKAWTVPMECWTERGRSRLIARPTAMP